MKDQKFVFRRHAIERMAERDISREDVETIVNSGEIIREYADDTPLPSRLILGWSEDRPLHVVAADDTESNETIVITVYEPDADIWNDDFRSKKA